LTANDVKASHKSTARGGMVIIEVLMALLIFGMAAVGLMRAITVSAQVAVVAQQELRMLLRLQSALTETSKYPNIEERYKEKPVYVTDPDDYGVYTRTEITLLEDITTAIDGQPVNDMYHIRVTAYYENFGKRGESSAETVRYARLYAATGAAAGGAPPPPAPVQ
jgi:Tfp pilus assembly protein PilV